MSVNGSNYTAIQKTDYYPFGLPYANSTNSEQQPYKFGGKEYDEMHGLNWYDQVARPFGAVIPITPTPDPLSEKYYNTSPYVQWGNNPVKFIDPDGKDIILFNVTHRNNSGRPDGTRGQVSSATNAALKDIVGTKEGRAFFAQFAKAGDVVGGYTFEENGKYSSTNLTVYDYSWEKETGNIIPSGVEGSIGVTKDKATLKISSYGKDKNEIGETLTHETQLHGTYAGNQIEGKKGVPTESQDHKALKNKDTKHDGYNNYNSVRKQLETTDENYKKTFKEAEGHAQRNY
jgi:RHS repeat-associated protein